MTEPSLSPGAEPDDVRDAFLHAVPDAPASHDLPLLHRTEVSGLPVFWSEVPGPFSAGLVFRVGRADERTPQSGITHLVEHLVLPAGRSERVEFNGAVSSSTTWFWAAGDRAAALDLLRSTARTMSSIPDRLTNERRILLTEAAGRGAGAFGGAAALRFGPSGHGLIGYPEFGLRWLDIDAVGEWARTRFTRGNVAAWMTGEPPAELELGLAEGNRWPAPMPRPIPEVNFPCVFPDAAAGGSAISLLMSRSSAASMAAWIAVERARQQLRYDRGLSYTVDLVWEPLTADVASVLLYCDCREGSEREAALLLRDVLQRLAAEGPSERELERELESRTRSSSDPGTVGGRLFAAASGELFGMPFESPAEHLAEAAAVTPDAAWSELDAALETALLMTRDATWKATERWPVYPPFSEERLSGRTHRPAGPRQIGLPKKSNTFVAADAGITFIRADGELTTVRFADCEVLERWPDGSRVLWGRDASRLTIEPWIWRDGDELVAWIDGHVDADRVVPMNPAVEARAAELFGEFRGSLVARELGWATAFLDFDETPSEILGATLGDHFGVLVVTAHRLFFVSRGHLLFDAPLHTLTSVQLRGGRWPQGKTLSVRTADGTWAFRDTTPSKRTVAFQAALAQALEDSGSVPVVKDAKPWHDAAPAYASFLGLPLSFLLLFPLAELEDLDSHARIALMSVLVPLICGGACAAGAWLGLVGRRRALDAGLRTRQANVGIGIGMGGVLLWVLLSLTVLLTEW